MSSQHLLLLPDTHLFFFFYYNTLVGVKNLIEVLIYISLITSDVEYLSCAY